MLEDEQIEIVQLISNILSVENKNKKEELWNIYKDISNKDKFQNDIINIIEKQQKEIGHLPSFDSICLEKKVLKQITPVKWNEKVIEDKLDKLSYSAFLKNKSRTLIEISKDIEKDKCISTANEKKLNELFVNNTVIPYADPFNYIQQMYANTNLATGFSTGVNTLDYKTGMLRKGTVNTILGFTGSGKTMWATNIAYLAAKDGHNVAYISLEISEEHEVYNFISRFSYELKNQKIKHRELKNRTLDDNEAKYVFDTLVPELKKDIAKHIKIIGENNFKNYSPKTFTSVLKTIDDLFYRETGKGIDMVVVDHIQLLKHRADNKLAKDGRELINSFVSYFRKQSLDFLGTNRQVCFLLLSQANRSSWEEADAGTRVLTTGEDGKSHYKKVDIGTYSLTGLAEANELERSSSVVLSVYTNETYIQYNEALVMVLKARNGEAMEKPEKTNIEANCYFFGDDRRFKDTEDTSLQDILNDTNNSVNADLENFFKPTLEEYEKM